MTFLRRLDSMAALRFCSRRFSLGMSPPFLLLLVRAFLAGGGARSHCSSPSVAAARAVTRLSIGLLIVLFSLIFYYGSTRGNGCIIFGQTRVTLPLIRGNTYGGINNNAHARAFQRNLSISLSHLQSKEDFVYVNVNTFLIKFLC